MKNKKVMKLKDKFIAILAIIRSNDFAVFTCKDLLKSEGAECIVSVGVEDKVKSKAFRDSISEFIVKL